MQITITFFKTNSVTFEVGGTGESNIDWGNGSSNTVTLLGEVVCCSYGYSDTAQRTITITGNIVYLNC